MIEKILKEINRLKKELDGYSASEALDYIEAYINAILREPASEDLEEVARHYLLYEHKSPLNEILHQGTLIVEMQYHEDIENAFKAGAEWQKQQMLKDVVEGQVFQAHDIDKAYEGFVYVISNQFKDLTLLPPNKVKIIIVKEE